MQELADYIRIPCRIAHGCKYCSSALPSSCLVKIEDAKNSLRLVFRYNLFSMIICTTHLLCTKEKYFLCWQFLEVLNVDSG